MAIRRSPPRWKDRRIGSASRCSASTRATRWARGSCCVEPISSPDQGRTRRTRRVRGFVIGTVVTAIAFYILVQLFPNWFSYSGGFLGLAVIAVIFGVINGLIGPIVKTLA